MPLFLVFFACVTSKIVSLLEEILQYWFSPVENTEQNWKHAQFFLRCTVREIAALFFLQKSKNSVRLTYNMDVEFGSSEVCVTWG